MYKIECVPPIGLAYLSKFDTEQEAVDAARVMAEKHKVQVDVLQVIRRIVIEVREQDINCL